ncbi:FAD/NAD(P)-binding domain-containing protein [Rhizodiscina lignyota]|uniref:FAD/NAD(P)-binding domain-containing protein n=1 Tax=Rhizodiscina lignyota TaxID=1504668 RepID=A0A9P4IGV0_9PEZI|nr:FAD/NAD(P)-binding domain-containing protein [Rhizodiscina lignyota]
MKVAILGAGPSGLATLKYLLAAEKAFQIKPIEVHVFEAEDLIGGTFRYRTYEDAELVSSKQLTTFSDFRCDVGEPDFLQAERYCKYLENYCTRFNLWPHIRLSTKVTSIRRKQNGGHIVTFCSKDGSSDDFECDAGSSNVPIVMHSSEFKSKTQFGTDKCIMVLGSGETAMDISYMAVTSQTKSVTMCHRDGFFCAPKRVPDPVIFGMEDPNKPLNVPVDVSQASLFDTAYVHRWLRDSPLLWIYYDRFIKYTLWLVSGTSGGLDQWVGTIPKERYHASKILFNKSNKAIPYISAPYRNYTWLQRIRSRIIQVPLPDTRDRKIDLAPWPKYIDEEGVVHFKDNGRPEYQRMRDIKCKPDVLIFATGYIQRFPFLDETYPTSAQANIRSVWKDDDPSVGFIGFVRPSFGAIPPLAEFQAQLWTLAILHRLPNALKPEDNYCLHTPPTARIHYGVDHESYAYQLALDVGSAPSIWEVAQHGWKVLLVWALGVNFNTKFRLVGPWKDDTAPDIMKTELWETITRRGGFFGHITLSGIPMLVFGTLSLFCYILSGLTSAMIWIVNQI